MCPIEFPRMRRERWKYIGTIVTVKNVEHNRSDVVVVDRRVGM
jgi:hypothetical protein